jgi:hypothetical protein
VRNESIAGAIHQLGRPHQRNSGVASVPEYVIDDLSVPCVPAEEEGVTTRCIESAANDANILDAVHEDLK